MLIPVTPFVPSEYHVKLATEAWEHREALALRRAVFCQEQRLFAFDDRDALDAQALTLVAVSCVSGIPEQVVGTVRIHEHGDGRWQGSRLAVQRRYRRVAALGSELIRIAVCTAHARGATRFTAQVQVQNVPLFERLHWRALESIEVCGAPHWRMEAELAHYPPCPDPDWGYVCCIREAA